MGQAGSMENIIVMRLTTIERDRDAFTPKHPLRGTANPLKPGAMGRGRTCRPRRPS